MFANDLPHSPLERATMLEGILIACATGESCDSTLYEHLRREFMNSEGLKDLLPSFVRTYRSLDAFWPNIKNEAPTYAQRRQIISAAFRPIIDKIENRDRAPGDTVTTNVLETFGSEGVHVVWVKALSRRATDPEGAITVARTLLETVCNDG